MSQNPERLILIHGAWQGAWGWARLLPELEKRGLEAVALDLPGNGHHPVPAQSVTEADYHTALKTAIEDSPGPVVLVGHSGGGMLATAGAEAYPEKVSLAVYLAGMLLPDERGFDEVQRHVAPELGQFGITPFIQMAPDGLTCSVPADMAIQHFYQDAEVEMAAAAAAQLTPQPMVGHRLRIATSKDRFGRVPKLYIEATEDQSIPIEAQRFMQSLVPEIDVASMNTGHAPQLVAPANLAEILSEKLSARHG